MRVHKTSSRLRLQRQDKQQGDFLYSITDAAVRLRATNIHSQPYHKSSSCAGALQSACSWSALRACEDEMAHLRECARHDVCGARQPACVGRQVNRCVGQRLLVRVLSRRLQRILLFGAIHVPCCGRVLLAAEHSSGAPWHAHLMRKVNAHNQNSHHARACVKPPI